MRAFLASMMIVGIAFAVTTSSVTTGKRLIALTGDETSQWKIRIIENARLALEMISAFYILTLNE